MIVFAHAGHWLASLAYVAPLLFLIGVILVGKARDRVSPLGDPVPFSAYLIGRLVNDTNYETQFNLDADRAYGYLTWDWIRRNDKPPQGKTAMNFP